MDVVTMWKHQVIATARVNLNALPGNTHRPCALIQSRLRPFLFHLSALLLSFSA